MDTLIIGSLALDSISSINESGDSIMGDSNPGKISSSIGGVGYNVSLAHNYGISSNYNKNVKQSYRLITAIGDDFTGKSIINQLNSQKIDTSGIYIDKSGIHSTSQYNSIHDKFGELIIACADMNIVEQNFMKDHIKQEIIRSQAKQVIIDCNLSGNTINEIVSFIKEEMNSEINLIIEPTSLPKSKRVSEINDKNLLVYPNNVIKLITPTLNELESIYESFEKMQKFDDYEDWFPILDSLGIDSQFREKLIVLERKFPIMKQLNERGIFQQSFKLIPYLSNILIKLGKHGVLLIQINKNIDDFKSIPTVSKYSPQFIITSNGSEYIDPNDNNNNKKIGIVIQYFSIPTENESINIKNVTGAGDSLIGFLSSTTINNNNWLNGEINSIEEEWNKWENIYKSQLASGFSLNCESSISDEIINIT